MLLGKLLSFGEVPIFSVYKKSDLKLIERKRETKKENKVKYIRFEKKIRFLLYNVQKGFPARTIIC
jgi:hypothetical protein